MNMLQHYQSRRTALMVRTDAILSSDPRAMKIEVPARNWNHVKHYKDASAIVLGGGGDTYGQRREVIMINPTEREFYTRGYNANRRGVGAFVLWFGAYGDTRLHVYADGLDSALESCAEWLAKYAPGHLTDQEAHTALVKEAFEDAGLPWTMEIDWNDKAHTDALESAEADLTYTESGYLTSHEWGLALENPSTEDLYAYVCGA